MQEKITGIGRGQLVKNKSEKNLHLIYCRLVIFLADVPVAAEFLEVVFRAKR